MKIKLLWIFLILSLLVAAILFFLNRDCKKKAEIIIKNVSFETELVLSNSQRSLGLSGRESLCQECAMLFVFSKAGNYGFWMKNMKFDLDIIWTREGKIVYIEKNFSKDSTETINPEVLADKVVEINAGLSDRYGFKIGDTVHIK